MIKSTEYLAIGILAMTSGIVTIQVFFRYVLNSSIGWSEEIVGFLLVWTTFSGAILAMDEGSHIGVDLLAEALPERFKWMLHLVIDLLVLVFLVVFAYTSAILCIKLSKNYAISVQISMSVVYFILPFSGLLMMITIFKRVYQLFHGLHKNRQSKEIR
jgi:TRAP-type C4-dicarboxylate transport system permease small subunit